MLRLEWCLVQGDWPPSEATGTGLREMNRNQILTTKMKLSLGRYWWGICYLLPLLSLTPVEKVWTTCTVFTPWPHLYTTGSYELFPLSRYWLHAALSVEKNIVGLFKKNLNPCSRHTQIFNYRESNNLWSSLNFSVWKKSCEGKDTQEEILSIPQLQIQGPGNCLFILAVHWCSYRGKKPVCPLLRRTCGFSLGCLSWNHWWMILLYPWEKGTEEPDVVVPSEITCSWIFELKRRELEGAGGQDVGEMDEMDLWWLLVSCGTLRNAEHLAEMTGL